MIQVKASELQVGDVVMGVPGEIFLGGDDRVSAVKPLGPRVIVTLERRGSEWGSADRLFLVNRNV